MEYIKGIINSIEKVFDVSEENISSLTVMLADIETSHLYNKFSAEEQSKKRSEEHTSELQSRE